MNLKKISSTIIIAAVTFSSCKKTDAPVISPVQNGPAIGEYILSEGSFNANDTKLSFYDNKTSIITGDFFLQQNPSVPPLGGVGNDMIIYGSKLYVVMNVSQNVTVLNAGDGKLITRIPFNGSTKQPRYAVGARGKVYVTAYDNTVSVIDTTTLAIIKTIMVGANPEGIAASANYLYVANSGGLNAIPDSTVSLIDLNTETEIRKIKVGINPNKIEINTAGNVFVSAFGTFTPPYLPASVSVINGAVNLSSINLGSNFSYSHIRIAGDIAYLFNNYGGTGTAKVYNTATNTVVRNEFITDATIVETPYGVNIDEQNGDVYIADAVNYSSAGKVTCFTSAGVKKFSFSTSPGVNPNKILFKR